MHDIRHLFASVWRIVARRRLSGRLEAASRETMPSEKVRGTRVLESVAGVVEQSLGIHDGCEQIRWGGAAQEKDCVVRGWVSPWERVHQPRSTPDSPDPVAMLAAGPIWESTDIEDWVAEHWTS